MMNRNNRASCSTLKIIIIFAAIFFMLWVPVACDNDDCNIGCGLKTEAGFFSIEPVHFTLRNDKTEAEFTSGETRIWYAFQPAMESPQDKPLVMLFNGGPGCATHFLFGFGTATWVVAADTPDLFKNPYTWRQFANLLYVDARGTGFSYGLMDNPENESERIAEFDTKNYNVFLDAGDFIRVLLRFLAGHPSIQRNPVMIAGESYGGTRSTVMLNLLLRYSEYGGTDEVYQDVALVNEIREHLDAVFPDEAGTVHPPESIAGQFGQQLLIEPLITGNNQFELSGKAFEQEGSIIYRIAEETGTTYVPCDPQNTKCDPCDNALEFVAKDANRDYYVYPKPYNWTFEQGYLSEDQLTNLEGLRRMTQIDPTDMTDLYASRRGRAYRVGEMELTGVDFTTLSGPRWEKLPIFARYSLIQCQQCYKPVGREVDGNLPETFGQLNPWDVYHIDCSFEILDVFYNETAQEFSIDPTNDGFGDMFLYNLLYVDTFITHAAEDLIIYPPVIPDSIARYDKYVQKVEYIDSPNDGEKRPGWIEVTYKDGAFGVTQGSEVRMIRFPIFDESGHTIEVNQPQALFEESWDWVQRTNY